MKETHPAIVTVTNQRRDYITVHGWTAGAAQGRAEHWTTSRRAPTRQLGYSATEPGKPRATLSFDKARIVLRVGLE
jgi:hypothetical protein